jgi:uncharacterized protein (DUF952 family)
MAEAIYHICRAEEWRAAQASGSYPGSSQDAADGFIHFSAAAQVKESAAKHRAGQTGLVLLAVDPDKLGPALKWEPSRGGLLFPHLYGPRTSSGPRSSGSRRAAGCCSRIFMARCRPLPSSPRTICRSAPTGGMCFRGSALTNHP